ncbi:hypothetical protein ID866_9573, partial [Astraeus odoratus]
MLLSTSKIVLHGWSPRVGSDDEVYVPSGEIPLIATLTPSDLSRCPLRRSQPVPSEAPPHTATHPPNQLTQPANSPPVVLTHRLPMAPSSGRRAQRNRSRDPSWIPRPRNAFIIFRCDYSREHTAQGSQDPDEQTLSKTLSKRAADAWRLLPDSEKDRYKLLAEREREEHAQMYPHYRFRPMRRHTSLNKRHGPERLSINGNTLEFAIKLPVPSPMPHTGHPQDDTVAALPSSSTPFRADKGVQPTARPRSASVPHKDILSFPPVVPSLGRDRRSYSLIDGIVIAREPSDCVAQIPHPPPCPTLDAPETFVAAGLYSTDLSSIYTNCTGKQGEARALWQAAQPGRELIVNSPHSSHDVPVPVKLPLKGQEDHTQLATPLNDVGRWNGNFPSSSPSAEARGFVSSSGYAASSSSQGSSLSPPPLSASTSSDSSGQGKDITICDVMPTIPEQSVCVPTDAATNTGHSLGNPDTFGGFSVCTGPSSYEEMERDQALEAYAIGLQNCDMFPPAMSMFE